MSLLLGCIADDFTGATDLANTLVRNGMRTIQVIGVPDGLEAPAEAEAIVIALKSRTAPVAEAVEQSVASCRWLRQAGPYVPLLVSALRLLGMPQTPRPESPQ